MKTVCSYCSVTMSRTEPDDGRISHGICGACFDFYLPPILEMDLSSHLEAYPEPVIMVNGVGRVMGINGAMSEFLQREPQEGLGLLGGELMGCRYAVLEGGCGDTVHCPECSIRKTVDSARARQADIEGVEVEMTGDDARLHLRVSAFPRREFVKLVVEEMLSVEPLSPVAWGPEDLAQSASEPR